MHHAYRDGYSVLPRLKRLAGESPFRHSPEDRDDFLRAKREAVTLRRCHFEHDMTAALDTAVCRFIVEHYPVALDPPHTLDNLAMQIQEDLAIVRTSGGRDWIAALHVCFPSHWRPEEKIGLPFAATHGVVPGMNLANSAGLVEAMIRAGPFVRYVWGLAFEPRLDGHPDRPRASFRPAAPRVFVKVERQVTIGFPDHDAALFLMRAHLFREDEIDRPALVEGLRQMSPEQREYKGVAAAFDDLIAYLNSPRSGPPPTK